MRVLEGAGYRVVGSDILGGVDFLEQRGRHGDVIVTNPPFSLAMEFKSLRGVPGT